MSVYSLSVMSDTLSYHLNPLNILIVASNTSQIQETHNPFFSFKSMITQHERSISDKVGNVLIIFQWDICGSHWFKMQQMYIPSPSFESDQQHCQ